MNTHGYSGGTSRLVLVAPVPVRATPTLTILDGVGAGARFPLRLEGTAYVLGRGDLADVRIDDHTVSRAHATIRLDGPSPRGRAAHVVDLGSSNGTFVNGRPGAVVKLLPGDKLQLGRAVLRYDILDEADELYLSSQATGLGQVSALLDAALFDRALGSIRLAYQPIVSSIRRRIVGWEALMRSGEPDLARPDEVLASAERLGRVREVGRVVRRLAAVAVPLLPPDTYLSVNLHPVELDDDDLFDPTSPLSLVADRVVLEITEKVSIEGIQDLEQRVTLLREVGFRIAIDDVGAGYAGLTTVTRFIPDMLKVDRAIVQDVDQSAAKARVIQSLASLCTELGVALVVEGIETSEERITVERMGADLMQGYLFARPSDHRPDCNVDF